MLDENSRKLAHSPYSTAKAFCQGAFAMMANPDRYQLPDDTTFILPFHHLIGFAAELYLKAFLIGNGFSADKLRSKPYGHDLGNLMDAAKLKGWKCQDAEVLVSYLHLHESYEYRYIRDDTKVELVRIDTIFDLLSSLDAYVDANIQASAALNRKVGAGWVFPGDAGIWRIAI